MLQKTASIRKSSISVDNWVSVNDAAKISQDSTVSDSASTSSRGFNVDSGKWFKKLKHLLELMFSNHLIC